MDVGGDNEDMATSESDDSSVGTNVSRLITEEDLIDSLFYTCNIEATERVSVSKLIDYLISTTGNISESVIDTHALDELRKYLDPDSDDISIDLNTYRSGISRWIQDLRIQELCESNSEGNDLCDSENESVFADPGLVISPSSENHSESRSLGMSLGSLNAHRPGSRATSTASQQTTLSKMSNTPTSFNRSDSTHKTKNDEIDMLNKIAELEFQNKKLVEDNSNLRKQLESSEETVSQIAQQLEELQMTEKSRHSTIDRMKDLRTENEELKLLVSSYEESKSASKRRLKETRNDVLELEKENLGSQSQISYLTLKLESSYAEKEELKHSLSHFKLMQEKSQQISSTFESQLNQKDVEVAEYKKASEELRLVNESLRNERSELEIQLYGSKEDDINKQPGGFTSGCRPNNDLSIYDDLMPVKLLPSAASTPCKTRSLCSELRTTILLDEPTIQSPLCDKEVEEIYRTAMSNSMVPERDTNNSHSSAEIQNVIDAALSSSANLGRLAEKSTRIANQFKEKKESMLIDLGDISQDRNVDQVYHMGTDLLKDKINAEVSQYADKIASLWMEKKCLGKRVFKLMEALKKLQEHNQAIERKNEEALKELEQESHRLNSYLKENLLRNQQQLGEEKSHSQMYKNMAEQANENILDLKEKMFDLEVKWKCCLAENKTLKEECDQLRRSNLEISEQYEKVDAQMTDLKDELGKATSTVNKEKERSSVLEESVCNTQLQRQMDMKDIWRLVHSDVEKECLNTSQELLETRVTVSADSLRDQVAKEIYSLRSQLARSQKALESLVGGRRRASVAVFSKGLGGLSLGSSNPGSDMQDPKSRLQSLFGESNVTAVVRRASMVTAPLRRLSLFSPTSSPDLSPQLTELSKAPPSRKRSTSEGVADKKAAQVILEEDEEADGSDPASKVESLDKAGQPEKEAQLHPHIPKLQVTGPHSEVDRNDNVKNERKAHLEVAGLVSEDSGAQEGDTAEHRTQKDSDSDEEFQDHLRQYLEEYLTEDELEPPYEGVLDQLYKAWPGWEQVALRFRYTVAGVVFLMGVLSLVLTFLPGASASHRGGLDIWDALERKLAPYLMVSHHRPPPT